MTPAVDTFTNVLRAISFGLAIALVGFLAEIVRHAHWQRRQAIKADTSLTECHCILVDAPHDWAEHPDWISQ